MQIFCDTSAFLAMLDMNDKNHPVAAKLWRGLIEEDAALITTNYVIHEAYALIQRRMGISALRHFHEYFCPLLHIVWLDATTHQKCVDLLLTVGQRDLSLTDCASFVIMRSQTINIAFAFDQHFDQQGFKILTEIR